MSRHRWIFVAPIVLAALFLALVPPTSAAEGRSAGVGVRETPPDATPAELRQQVRELLAPVRRELATGAAALPARPPALRPEDAGPARGRDLQTPPVPIPDLVPGLVRVRCDLGQTISQALRRPHDPLVIEVSGFCDEDVDVRRDNVTIRGTDPATDGVRGAGSGLNNFDGVIEIRGARNVSLENLTIREGNTAGVAVNYATNVSIDNCEIVDNATHAISAAYSLLIAVSNSTLDNPGRGISAFATNLVSCTNCAIDAGGFGVLAAESSLVSIQDSTLASANTPLVALLGGSEIDVVGSTVVASGFFGMIASDFGQIILFDSDVSGVLVSQAESEILLQNTNHSSNPFGFNIVDLQGLISLDSVVEGVAPSKLTGSTFIDNFANVTVRFSSTVDGDLLCFGGGDAYCDVPANVSGVSTCPQC